MSKIANWGRWLVAVYIVTAFAISEWRDAALVDWHKLGEIFLEIVGLALLFAVVRGVLTWANWAHALLVLLCSGGLFVFVSVFISGNTHRLGRFWPVNLAICLTMLVWLLLPSVRAGYWNSEHVS
jgi:hypothetical protein